jgi:hypothetical protein
MSSHSTQMEPLPVRVEEINLKEWIDSGRLKFLELNARFMKSEEFGGLVANIKRDGRLTSIPLAAINKDKSYSILSGNHRVKAALKAEAYDAFVMFTDKEMTKAERTARILSHNSISGQDDPAILKQMYSSIDEVDWKKYAKLDDHTLKTLEAITIASLNEARPEFRVVTMTFLPSEIDRVKEIFEEAKRLIAGEAWLVPIKDYDRALTEIEESGAAYGVKNFAVSFMKMLDIVERHKLEFAEGYSDEQGLPKHSELVPVSTIFGTNRLPAKTAARLHHLMEHYQGAHETDMARPWEALDKLMDDAQQRIDESALSADSQSIS